MAKAIRLGLGERLMTVSIGGYTEEQFSVTSHFSLLLLTPSRQRHEIRVLDGGVDRVAMTLSAHCPIHERGTYRLGCKVHFTDGRTLTSSSSSVFYATDGQD